MIDHICSNLIKFRTAYLNLGIIILGFWKDFQFFDSDFIRDRTVRLKKVLLLLFWSLKGIFKGGFTFLIFLLSSVARITDFLGESWVASFRQFFFLFFRRDSHNRRSLVTTSVTKTRRFVTTSVTRICSRFCPRWLRVDVVESLEEVCEGFCSAFSIDHLRERRWGLGIPLLGVRLILLVLLSRQLQQWKHILLSILPNSWPLLWEIILGRSTVHLV